MKKILIKEEIFTKSFDGNHYDIKFSDLPQDILEDDIIDIRRDSETNSFNAYTELTVIRTREETDIELQQRLNREQKMSDKMKQLRYDEYLKLKKEFELS